MQSLADRREQSVPGATLRSPLPSPPPWGGAPPQTPPLLIARTENERRQRSCRARLLSDFTLMRSTCALIAARDARAALAPQAPRYDQAGRRARRQSSTRLPPTVSPPIVSSPTVSPQTVSPRQPSRRQRSPPIAAAQPSRRERACSTMRVCVYLGHVCCNRRHFPFAVRGAHEQPLTMSF